MWCAHVARSTPCVPWPRNMSTIAHDAVLNIDRCLRTEARYTIPHLIGQLEPRTSSVLEIELVARQWSIEHLW